MEGVDVNALPVWVLAVVVILKVVFDFLRSWKEGKEGGSAEEKKLAVALRKLDVLEDQVKDVHDLVTKTDADGTPLIYNRSSMEGAIRGLTSVLNDVRQVLSDLHHENRQQTEILKRVAQEQARQGERLAKLSSDLPRIRMDSGVRG